MAPVLSLLLLLTVAFNANRWLMVLMTTSSCDSWILKQNVHLLLLHSSPRLHSSNQSFVSIVHVHLRRQRQIRDVFISPIRSSIVTTRLVQSTVFLSLIFTLHFPPLPLPSLLPPRFCLSPTPEIQFLSSFFSPSRFQQTRNQPVKIHPFPKRTHVGRSTIARFGRSGTTENCQTWIQILDLSKKYNCQKCSRYI